MAAIEVNKRWESIYVYYGGDTMFLLSHCIIPLIRELLKNGMASSYFYIFYNEMGRHVRLRLLTDTQDIETFCRERISLFLDANPSKSDNKKSTDLIDEIHLVKYEPEYTRYGGNRGIEIAEMQFRNSSDIVTSLVEDGTIKNYNSSLIFAMRLLLISSFAYCKTTENVLLFLRFIYSSRAGLRNESFLLFHEFTEHTHWRYFVKQRSQIVQIVKACLDDINQNNGGEYRIWKKNEEIICEHLKDSYDMGELELPYMFSNYLLWPIFESYIHMTNNRLGIRVQDESLVAYFIMEALKEIYS